jgi:AcrR family transcriptional regulator
VPARRSDFMEAMVDLAFERGYDSVTVDEVAERAGSSVAEFESVFGSKMACAVAILEEVAENNLRAVRGAFDSEPSWPDSLRAAAYAHAEWIAEHPKEMHFGLLQTLWASELTGALRDHFFGEYVAMVDAGREVAADPDTISASTAFGVVGAITEVIARRVGEAEGVQLADLVPEMMYLAVRPYLGEEAARRELTVRRAR